MRALVFDLDGTLLQYSRDYEDLITASFEDVCGSVQEPWLETYNETFFEEFAARNADPVERAFESTGAPGDADEFAQRLHDAEIAATVSPTEAHADLERLGEEFALAVLTNGLPDWQRGKLAASDLDSYFDAVVTSFDVGAHKPDPEPFREVERRIDADGYAMIGDSDDDVDGAEAAGWESLRYDGGRLGDVPAALDWI